MNNYLFTGLLITLIIITSFIYTNIAINVGYEHVDYPKFNTEVKMGTLPLTQEDIDIYLAMVDDMKHYPLPTKALYTYPELLKKYNIEAQRIRYIADRIHYLTQELLLKNKLLSNEINYLYSITPPSISEELLIKNNQEKLLNAF